MTEMQVVRTFRRNVTAIVPTDDPEKFDKVTFTARYRQLPKAAVQEASAEGNETLLPALITELKGVPVPGVAEPTLEQQLQQLVDDLALGNAAVANYFDALAGVPEGNSGKSRRR